MNVFKALIKRQELDLNNLRLNGFYALRGFVTDSQKEIWSSLGIDSDIVSFDRIINDLIQRED